MIKLLKSIFITAIVAMSVLSAASAKEYKEGKDYEVRAENKTTTPEIREFFSFFCNHCNAMDENFSKVKEHFKSKAKYVYNPIGLLGGDLGVETQFAYAIALNIGIEEELRNTLLDKIHNKDELPQDHSYFVDLFASFGVPEDQYERDYSNFVTQAKVAEYDRKLKELKIEAVPEIVVNGKYFVKSDDLESVEDYINVIDYLLTLP